MGTISRTGCSVTELTNLTRQLRIAISLNQPAGEAPIVTEAGVTSAPAVTAPEGPAADLPSGEAPAGPTAEAPPTGGGSENIPTVSVPSLIGLTVPAATALLNSPEFALLDLGTITTPPNDTGLITVQNPGVGTSVSTLTLVDVVLGAEEPGIPEPSTFMLFALGLSLLIIMTWWQRRRLG